MKCPLCYYRKENQAPLEKIGESPSGGGVYKCPHCQSVWKEISARLVGTGSMSSWFSVAPVPDVYCMALQLLELGEQMKKWQEEDRKKEKGCGGCGE